MQRPGSGSAYRASLWSRFNSVGRVLAAVVFLHLIAVLALTAHSRAQGGPIVLLPVLYMWRGDFASKPGHSLQTNSTAMQKTKWCEWCDEKEADEKFSAAEKDSEDLVEAIKEVEGHIAAEESSESENKELSAYQQAKLAKRARQKAAEDGQKDGMPNPIRLPTLPKDSPPPPSPPPPTLLDADAAEVAEADRQEQKLHLLEQLRERRKEVERLMAQRRAEREGISLEEAEKKQAGKENVEKAVLAVEKPQENVKKAFRGGQNGRVQPAPAGFLATLFRKDERPKEDKSWLDRMSDAILDKLELRWEDDEEARMQDDEDGTSEPQMSADLQLDDKVADPDKQKANKQVYRMWPADDCANALRIPKVAMMYLTKGKLHHEETWKLWFEFAAGKIPLTAVKSKCETARLEQAARACAVRPTSSAAEVLSNQHLFNVYIHVGLNNDEFEGYPNNSLWHNRDIIERVQVEWGKHSLVTATRNLLQVALQEPLNKKFILLSESGIPLYPPTALYHQLMIEEKSRLNSCTLPGWERHPHRWSDKMESPTFRREHWRKSSQWFALNRDHAELVMGDTVINQAFHDHCYPTTEDGWWRDCFSDEHVFATLMAVMGKENETDCKGFLMHVDWSRGGAHPRTYEQREISAARLRLLRMPTENCGYPSAIKTAAAQFVESEELNAGVCSKEVVEYSRTLGPQCPLLARKFPEDTAAAITTLISECKNRLKIVHGNDCHHRLAMMKKYL